MPEKATTTQAVDHESRYKEIRSKLEARFPDEAHQKRDDFTYLDPRYYRERLNEVFTNGYSFRVYGVVYRPEGLYGGAAFKADIDGISFEREVIWAEPWMFAKDSKDIIKADVKVQMAVSAALKSVCRELGIALYLYDKSDAIHGKAKLAPAQSNSSNSSGQSRGPVGTEETDIWKFGQKWGGQPISAIDDGYFEWAIRESKPGPMLEAAKVVMERRSKAATSQTFDSVTGNEEGFVDEIQF